MSLSEFEKIDATQGCCPGTLPVYTLTLSLAIYNKTMPIFLGNIDLGSNSNSSSNNQKSASFDLWKMDSLMDSGYINTYFRAGGSNSNSNNGGSTNYPSLQAFPSSSQAQTANTAGKDA